MSDAFNPGLSGFLAGEVDWDSSGIKCLLIEAGTYTFNATHTFVSDVTGAGAVIASTTALLTGKTTTGGVADADDTIFASVAAGDPCDQIVIYQSTAVGDEAGGDVAATAQRLILHLDDAENLPITPSGIDIRVTWSNGIDRIFRFGS